MKRRLERPFEALVAAVLFLAVCAWLGAGLYERLNPAVQTAVARRVTVTESVPLQGIALRQEEVLCSRSRVEGLAEPGRRLPAGAVVCVARGEEYVSEASAVFLNDWDGYEHLGPHLLEGLDAQGLQGLLNAPPQMEQNAFGRLVYDHAWVFAALCEEELSLSPGPCRVLFDGQEQSVSARLLSAENGLVLLRLQAEGELLSLRKTGAKLILSEREGLAVPAEAVHTAPDGDYVEILTAQGSEMRSVSLLAREDGLYIAALSSQEGALREGSTVIVHRDRRSI